MTMEKLFLLNSFCGLIQGGHEINRMADLLFEVLIFDEDMKQETIHLKANSCLKVSHVFIAEDAGGPVGRKLGSLYYLPGDTHS